MKPVDKDNNKNAIVIGMTCGGIIGLIIGVIVSLGKHNDSFVCIYAAPIYIYSYLFNGGDNENIAICVYYFLVGLCICYLYFANRVKKKKLGITAIILLHIGLTILGVRAISKDLKEFLNNMPTKMIVDAMSGKNDK